MQWVLWRLHRALQGQYVACNVLGMEAVATQWTTITATMIITMCLLSIYFLFAHRREEELRLVETTSCFLLVCFSGFVFPLTEGHRVSMSKDRVSLCGLWRSTKKSRVRWYWFGVREWSIKSKSTNVMSWSDEECTFRLFCYVPMIVYLLMFELVS